MRQLGIAHLGPRRFPELSGGEQQLVLLARALAQGSKVLILDEPTANLDYGNQVRILRALHALAREGYSILMSSHVPDHAFLVCNKVALLKEGRLHGPGAPQALLTDAVLSDLYGTAIRVVRVPLAAGSGAGGSYVFPSWMIRRKSAMIHKTLAPLSILLALLPTLASPAQAVSRACAP